MERTSPPSLQVDADVECVGKGTGRKVIYIDPVLYRAVKRHLMQFEGLSFSAWVRRCMDSYALENRVGY